MDLHHLKRRATRLLGELAPTLAAARVVDRLVHPRRLPIRDWERPAAESARRVEFRSGLSGLRWGSRGPAVLALHGWEGRATQFRFIAEALVRSGRTLIALDGPAHGASPGHVAHPRLFAEALVDAAAEITAEAGRIEAVIGHSMGAGALSYALSLGLPVERAVLIAGPSSYEDVVRGAAAIAGLGPRATREVLREIENRTGVAPATIDVARAADAVELPILVVHDREDSFVDFHHAQRFLQHLPDARLIATEGLGHWRVLTDPATVARIAGFIARAQPQLLPLPRAA